jgi:hypothetical protein
MITEQNHLDNLSKINNINELLKQYISLNKIIAKNQKNEELRHS